MGTSCSAGICFGIAFPYGYQFPWDESFEDWDRYEEYSNLFDVINYYTSEDPMIILAVKGKNFDVECGMLLRMPILSIDDDGQRLFLDAINDLGLYKKQNMEWLIYSNLDI